MALCAGLTTRHTHAPKGMTDSSSMVSDNIFCRHKIGQIDMAYDVVAYYIRYVLLYVPMNYDVRSYHSSENIFKLDIILLFVNVLL